MIFFYIEVQKLSDIKLEGNKTLLFAQLLLGSKPILERTVSESILGSPSKIVCN